MNFRQLHSRMLFGKAPAAALALSAALVCGFPVATYAQSPALGSGGVTTGQASISQLGNTTNVNQSSQAVTIKWQSFSIGTNVIVNFNQPNSTAVALNRVVGSESSVIEGALNANGHVFLINGNGILITKAGQQVTLNFNGDSLVGVTVDQGTLDALVENKQAIYSDGGRVILTAKSAGDLLSAQVNNSGLIEARTLDDVKGDILLLAAGGVVNVGGTLDASALLGGDGGSIETSGQKVTIDVDAIITTLAANGATGTMLSH